MKIPFSPPDITEAEIEQVAEVFKIRMDQQHGPEKQKN